MKNNRGELFVHLHRYAKTGVIDDFLVRYYDQHGQWRGPTVGWQSEEETKLLDIISRSYLPYDRRTRDLRSGVILRTSYYGDSLSRPELPYRQILGSLVVKSNVMIDAPDLDVVCGSIIADTDQLINLPNLRYVGCNLEVMRSSIVAMPRLRRICGDAKLLAPVPNSLRSVGGLLGLYGADPIRALSLTHVGGYLLLHHAQVAYFPLLRGVNGGLLVTHPAHLMHMPCLHQVSGNFYADHVLNLYAPQLRMVGGDLVTTSAIDFFNPQLHVGGDWTSCPGAHDRWMRRQAARRAILGHYVSLEI